MIDHGYDESTSFRQSFHKNIILPVMAALHKPMLGVIYRPMVTDVFDVKAPNYAGLDAVSLNHGSSILHIEWGTHRNLRRRGCANHILADCSRERGLELADSHRYAQADASGTVLWAPLRAQTLLRVEVLADRGTPRAFRLTYLPYSIVLSTGHELADGDYHGDGDRILVFSETDQPSELAEYPVMWDSESPSVMPPEN